MFKSSSIYDAEQIKLPELSDHGVHFKFYRNTYSVGPEEYKRLQFLEYQYYKYLLGNRLESDDENELMAEAEKSARAAVFLDDPSRYVLWRFDPNNEVRSHATDERRYRTGQKFRNPSLVIASDNSGLPLGFAETVDNISGNKIKQIIKRFGLKKRFIKFEQLFADPNLEADLQL